MKTTESQAMQPRGLEVVRSASSDREGIEQLIVQRLSGKVAWRGPMAQNGPESNVWLKGS